MTAVWNRILVVAATLMTMVSSCSKNAGEEPRLLTRRVEVTMSIETKTSLNSDRTKLVWSEGDKIALLNNSTSDVIELTYQEGGKIVAELPAAATAVTAIYPSAMASGISIPAVQTQSEAGVLDSGRLPMSAAAAVEGNGISLLFNPSAGTLALNIYKSTGLSSGEKLRALRVASHTLTVSEPYQIGDTKPADRQTFPGQLYLVLPRDSYEAPAFEIETTAGLYTISAKEGYTIDLENNDFFAQNIDLAKAVFEAHKALADNESFTLDPEMGMDSFYPAPKDANIIPDFSSVGYHYGERAIPDIPVGLTVSAPSDGSDATALIQDAVDNCPAGKAVLLKAGTYNISGTIWIERSNIVLRGEGNSTLLYATGTAIRDIIVVGNCGRTFTGNWPNSDHLKYSYGNPGKSGSWAITDNLVPCGRWFVTVGDPSGLAVGDKIFVIRVPTQDWMDRIGPDGEEAWTISSTTFRYSRVIKAISGNKIYLDAPITFQIENGTGTVYKRISTVLTEVGVEYLSISSEYDSSVTSTVKDGTAGKLNAYCSDENKMFNCITMGGCEDCWVRYVEGSHFTQSLVRVDSWARKVSVLNCHAYDPICLNSGQRRYAFHLCGEMTLVKDCVCERDRHAFVTYAWIEGPNAFVNCSAVDNYAELGPHQRMTNGVLYDNLTIPNTVVSKYYSRYGVLYSSNTAVGRAGHGWTGANIVAWNCSADYQFRVYGQSADGIYNYAVGCLGKKAAADANCGRDGTLATLEDGTWYPELAYGATGTKRINLNSVPSDASSKAWWPQFAPTTFTHPESLYESQLEQRLNYYNLRFDN